MTKDELEARMLLTGVAIISREVAHDPSTFRPVQRYRWRYKGAAFFLVIPYEPDGSEVAAAWESFLGVRETL